MFHRKTFEYEISLSGNRILKFQTIADGHKAVLTILAELLIRRDVILEESGVTEPDGIVLIDEIETHLHLRLQEVVLPFLVDLFPNVQFIVATHSPAVLTSVPDALIYDFASKESYSSSELQGIEYGTLMTSYFGIETEYDRDTTKKLSELQQLYKNVSRSSDEEKRMLELANELAGKSHSIAMHILLDLESKK